MPPSAVQTRWRPAASGSHLLAHFRRCGLGGLCLLSAVPLSAQDLDPRAYGRAPVNATFLITGFSVSHGGVVTDASLPLTVVHATVETPSLGIARSFSLFGQTARRLPSCPTPGRKSRET